MKSSSEPTVVDVCIVGLGPAGLGTAIQLARSSASERVICIDAGLDARKRKCEIQRGGQCAWYKPCNITSGVGGSALLSSGKVSEFPAGRSLQRFIEDGASLEKGLREAMELFSSYVSLLKDDRRSDEVDNASSSFRQQGFDFRYYPSHRFAFKGLLQGLAKMLEDIERAGIGVSLSTKVTDLKRTDGRFQITTESPAGRQEVIAKNVVLASGRVGSSLLNNVGTSMGLGIEPSRIDVGVRVEFPSRFWPQIDSCHNDLKLHFGNARTFCVCKDGWLAPYRVSNVFLMEGHSDPEEKSGFTNLAVTVRQDSASHPDLFGKISEALLRESGGLPVRQPLGQFLDPSHPGPDILPKSTINFWRAGRISNILPSAIFAEVANAVTYLCTAFISKELWPSVSIFGPEVDFFWPRYKLGVGFETECPGLHIAGDGSGHFRGILQAFYSGIVVADFLLKGRNA